MEHNEHILKNFGNQTVLVPFDFMLKENGSSQLEPEMFTNMLENIFF